MTKFKHDRYTLKALKTVQEGQSLFITGKAGTGKTMLLRKIEEEAKAHGRNVAICAPTGVAAIHANGVTLHRLLRLPISFYIPGHTVQRLYSLSIEEELVVRKLDLLIIDEVSMVRCDTMDMVDDILRHYRHSEAPFGGVQVVMFGDLCQLMPVAKDDEWVELEKYYQSHYFFSSNVVRKMELPMLELKTVHRQKDVDFIELLNRIRDGKLMESDERILRAKYKKGYEPSDALNYIRLTTHKYKAEKYNQSRLEDLRGTLYEYKAYTEGRIPEKDFPKDIYVLKFKIGARVMFTANDELKRYANGTLGRIVALDDNVITVRTDNGMLIEVVRAQWDFYKYQVNKVLKIVERMTLGKFTQFPLRLAWAVTIHKSQGLTFDNVVIDAGKSFAFGQVYVALSRCRTFQGIMLASPITADVVATDPKVTEYIQLTKRIWPDEEEVKVEHSGNASEYISRFNYKPIGNVFKAPWDGKYYDCWESATSYYHLDLLVESDTELRRLCVCDCKDDRELFDILANREYDLIKSVKFYGGTTSQITIDADGKKEHLNFHGFKFRGTAGNGNTQERWDEEPRLRIYTFNHVGGKLHIIKESMGNKKQQATIRDFSDLGKLLLCCDQCKIVRNDGSSFDVGYEGKVYKELHYTIDGKAMDVDSQMVADKWYQKNQDIAGIKKTFEEIPVTRENLQKVVKQLPKNKKTSTRKPRDPLAIYPQSSLERRILECLRRIKSATAKDIANSIGCTRGEVNSRLYGTLKANGLVEKESLQWRLSGGNQ